MVMVMVRVEWRWVVVAVVGVNGPSFVSGPVGGWCTMEALSVLDPAIELPHLAARGEAAVAVAALPTTCRKRRCHHHPL